MILAVAIGAGVGAAVTILRRRRAQQRPQEPPGLAAFAPVDLRAVPPVATVGPVAAPAVPPGIAVPPVPPVDGPTDGPVPADGGPAGHDDLLPPAGPPAEPTVAPPPGPPVEPAGGPRSEPPVHPAAEPPGPPASPPLAEPERDAELAADAEEGSMAAYPDGGGSVAFREAQGRLLRARLAARGLVRTSPSVRIREIAADAPDRDRRPTSPLAWIEPPADQPAVEIAKSDLDPEPDGPRSSVQCPSCRQSQQVAVEATGYRCLSCGRVWRWAVCHSCDRLAMTVAHQESWQCTCGSFTRSWWRTDTAAREGPRVVTRRRDETIRIQRELAVSRAGRRRWKLIASGLAAVLVAAGVAVVVTTGGSDSEAGATTAACSHFERVRSGIVNGEIDASELRMTLAAIRSEAEGAEAGVRVAARRLAAVGAPDTADFLVAQTEMADACESAGA